ncbi:hypothetical protein Metbo_1739 [Methanobacterium lacus]|uniref:Uncharacterized protein n=1 Tax=Methanobacterium lacus (strain AL-21) TaxID=877455 RepID=F0T9T4_METLA|nr:hypothetical protein Metbo_1739 [Methanobacterium lacus]
MLFKNNESPNKISECQFTIKQLCRNNWDDVILILSSTFRYMPLNIIFYFEPLYSCLEYPIEVGINLKLDSTFI